MLDGRIVGGEDADISELPYQLSVEYFFSHICGSSILSTTRALTSVHCTEGSVSCSLTVRAGTNTRGSGGQQIQVIKISQHPQYDSWNIDYDVSVLILERALVLGPNVAPVALAAEGSELDEGTLATVSGWGTTSSGGSSPTTLKKVDVPKVTDEYCKNAYGSSSITDRMTCHGLEAGGKDSCQGDSGGPLVSGGVQVGVVSWGAGCAAANYPGVYAKVANAEILSHINSSA